MIKAIIFDCFGVLASDGLLPFRQKYFRHDPELMRDSIEHSHRVDARLADYDDFIREQAKMAGLSEHEARRQIECNVPDENLFAYIKESLKPNYRLGLLSNAGANWLPEIFMPWQVQLFDTINLSYQTGLAKPDERAYESVANKLGLEMQDCIMVDDQPGYVEGAKRAGMRAVLYESFPQFKQQLELILAEEGV